jgi:hypothetical protein
MCREQYPMPALIRASILLATALMAPAASGQDNASPGLDALLSRAADARSEQQLGRVMAEIEALDPVPDLLPRLLEANPNAYVYALQSGLREAGYASPLSGIMGRSTVTQLSAFCADKGIDAQCRLGPLLPDVARAIGAALASPAEATVSPAEMEPPAAVPAAETGLPAGWSVDDGQPFGIATRIEDATATRATIHIEGSPTRDGWLNIYLSPPVDAATSERWIAAIDQASVTGQADAEQTVRFLVALRSAAGSYMGELFDGIALPEAPTPLEGSGMLPDGAALLQPYVQVRFASGQELAIAVTVEAPDLAPAD